MQKKKHMDVCVRVPSSCDPDAAEGKSSHLSVFVFHPTFLALLPANSLQSAF